jgi:hypothetical protein
MREERMNAGLDFYWRQDVESIFDAVAFMGNRKNSRVGYSVERIAHLSRAHPMHDGEIVINIDAGEQRGSNEEYSFQDQTHSIGSPVQSRTRITGCLSTISRFICNIELNFTTRVSHNCSSGWNGKQ